MSARPLLSVCICTHARPASLARALADLAAAAPPVAAAWEVVVVDSASPGGSTRQVVAAAPRHLPLRYVREDEPGHSRARNRAIDEAAGDLLVWTDDDVSVAPGWLRAYEAAWCGEPDLAVLGGPIRPRFEGATPTWIEAVRLTVPTSFAWLEPEGTTVLGRGETGACLPFGANMAVRGDLQRAHRYDVALGRHPGRHLLGGEETAVLGAILDQGARGRWVPEARVEHRIDRTRQTMRYQARYWFGVGFVQGRTRGASDGPAAADWRRHLVRMRRRQGRRWWWRDRWRRGAAGLAAWRDRHLVLGQLAGYAEGCRPAREGGNAS